METFFYFTFIALFAFNYAKKFNYEFVTCGSTLKLMNAGYNVRLHSHDVMYGSGSGQQSVTGVDLSDDSNSYWNLRGTSEENCTRGAPVRCGQMIRLTHMSTRRNLHSHHYQSPLSGNLEVSAFGEDGIGDNGDNWIVECNGEEWSRNEKIQLKHAVTNYYLHVSGEMFGRPIHGQLEISGYPSQSDMNYWTAAEGIYVKPSLPLHTMSHDEL